MTTPAVQQLVAAGAGTVRCAAMAASVESCLSGRPVSLRPDALQWHAVRLDDAHYLAQMPLVRMALDQVGIDAGGGQSKRGLIAKQYRGAGQIAGIQGTARTE